METFSRLGGWLVSHRDGSFLKGWVLCTNNGSKYRPDGCDIPMVFFSSLSLFPFRWFVRVPFQLCRCLANRSETGLTPLPWVWYEGFYRLLWRGRVPPSRTGAKQYRSPHNRLHYVRLPCLVWTHQPERKNTKMVVTPLKTYWKDKIGSGFLLVSTLVDLRVECRPSFRVGLWVELRQWVCSTTVG